MPASVERQGLKISQEAPRCYQFGSGDKISSTDGVSLGVVSGRVIPEAVDNLIPVCDFNNSGSYSSLQQ
jgi:hypothetical protein